MLVNFFKLSDLSTESELKLAYEEACSRGSKRNYRIHLAVIGHSEAGKTSFIDRLLGKEFQEQRESTEGIHTHFVKSSFNKKNLISHLWEETKFEASVLEKDFHESVLAQRKAIEIEKHQTVRTQRKASLLDERSHRNILAQKSLTELKKVNAENMHIKVKQWLQKSNFSSSTDSPHLEPLQKYPTSLGNNTTAADVTIPVETAKTQTAESRECREEVSHISAENNSTIITRMRSEGFSRFLRSKETYPETTREERIPYSVNIRDHGGQNEFIITNQLFLNIEAFILMVMDISLDFNIPLKQSLDAEGKFGIPKTPAQILCYWLNALHVMAMEKTTEPNIALVLTHNDMIKVDDIKMYIDSYIEKLLECIHGKPYASYIKEEHIFVVDNRKGTVGDFAHIRNRIFVQIAKQKSWGIERPTRWLKLEADILETAKEAQKPYLHISSVKDLASAFAMNKKELGSFLRFHHILGDLIYYPDKKINDFIVTNPQWLLEMFKTLITPHEFLKRRNLKPEIMEELKRAIMSEDTLKFLWEGNDVEFLKDVLMKFDLMLPLGSEQMDNKYLIPCMLKPQEVEIGLSDPFTGMALIYNSTLEPECGDTMSVGACHKLLSQCSKTLGWTVCADDHLSYTQAFIEIDDRVHMELKLQKSNSIQVSIWSSREKLDNGHLSINEARTLIARAHKTTAKGAKMAGLNQKENFKMLCPHWNPGEEYVCLVTVDEKKEVPQNMPIFSTHTKKCTIHKQDLEPVHFPWTKKDFDSDGKF